MPHHAFPWPIHPPRQVWHIQRPLSRQAWEELQTFFRMQRGILDDFALRDLPASVITSLQVDPADGARRVRFDDPTLMGLEEYEGSYQCNVRLIEVPHDAR